MNNQDFAKRIDAMIENDRGVIAIIKMIYSYHQNILNLDISLVQAKRIYDNWDIYRIGLI